MNLSDPLAQQFLDRFAPRKPHRSDFPDRRSYHRALREWRVLRRAVITQVLQATEAELRALLS